MGTLYYAVNHVSKQAVEMGKHYWPLLVDRTFSTIEELAAALLLDMQTNGNFGDECKTAEYARFIAEELWRIGTAYEIVHEVSDPANYEGVVLTGSRYSDPKSRNTIGTLLSSQLSP